MMPAKGKRMIWVCLGALALVVLGVCGCSLTRAGYETVAYQATVKEARFEIREYPTLELVSTPMAQDSENEGQSFRRLFGYISGENVASQKIAMTTPVFMQEGEVVDQMSFVVPESVVEKGTPQGTKPSVEVTMLEGGRYAAYRLKGGRTDAKIDAAKKALTEWLNGRDLAVAGPFIVAGFDPPFIPGMLQRNEVMVRVQ